MPMTPGDSPVNLSTLQDNHYPAQFFQPGKPQQKINRKLNNQEMS